MLFRAILLVAQVAQPDPSGADASPATPPAAEATEPRGLRVVAPNEIRAALCDELALRVDDRPVSAHVAGAPIPRGQTVLIVRNFGEGFRLTLVLDSGEAYDREMSVSTEQSARALAATTASLLRGVAEGSVHPDRTAVSADAEVARDDAGDGPAPQDVESQHEAAETDPAPPDETLPPAPPPPPAAPAAASPRWALEGRATYVAGAAPGYASFGRGFMGGARLLWKFRGIAAVDLRAQTREVRGLRLTRIRVGAGGGVRWQRGSLAVPLVALATLEPWTTRRGGEAVLPRRDGKAGHPPLIGVALDVAPTWFWRAGPVQLGVGLTAGLALSAAATSGFPVPGLRVEGGPAAVGLGGLELEGGLRIALRPAARSARVHPRAVVKHDDDAEQGNSESNNDEPEGDSVPP